MFDRTLLDSNGTGLCLRASSTAWIAPTSRKQAARIRLIYRLTRINAQAADNAASRGCR